MQDEDQSDIMQRARVTLKELGVHLLGLFLLVLREKALSVGAESAKA